jgi:hypothetical protein
MLIGLIGLAIDDIERNVNAINGPQWASAYWSTLSSLLVVKRASTWGNWAGLRDSGSKSLGPRKLSSARLTWALTKWVMVHQCKVVQSIPLRVYNGYVNA